MKLNEVKLKPPKIIFYGAFGSGKTAFALTGGEKVQIIDLDDGLRTGQTFKDKWFDERQKIDVIECHEDEPERAIAYQKTRSYISSIATECRAGTYKYKILVIDSLTKLSEFCMRNILSMANMLGKHPGIQHWGIRDIEFMNLLVIIKSLPIAVILVAHQQVNEQDGISVLSPSLPGKSLPPNLFAAFDEILFFRVRSAPQDKREYLIQNASSSCVLARTRSNAPNDVNVDIGLVEYLKLLGCEV